MATFKTRKKTPRTVPAKDFKPFTLPGITVENLAEADALIKLFKTDLDNEEAVAFIEKATAKFRDREVK